MLAVAAAAGLEAQSPPQPARPKPTADQDLQEAQGDVRRAAAQIARVPLSMATEPAFQFRA
jgi:hypothetical protein